MAGLAGWVVGALDRAEGDIAAAHGAGVGLAQVDEAVAKADAAIGFQQHRFRTVKDIGQRDAQRGEGGGECLGVILHQGGGGGADQAAIVEGADQQRAGVVAVGGKVGAFIIQRAVVKIGPVAEHGDAQAGDVIKGGLQGRAGQAANLDLGFGHAETCAIQSLRL